LDYKDYYATLKVKKDASQDEIQKAYRKLARKFHPDVNKNSDAELKFKEIGEAYEVLKDPDKRKKYDQFGAAWKHAQSGGGAPPDWQGGGFDFGGFDFRDFASGAGGRAGGGDPQGFSSFFEMLFGGAGRGGRAGGVRWADARSAAGSPFGGGASAGGRGSNFGESPFGIRGGADAEATLQLTLEEAMRGGTREISYNDPTTGERRTISVKIPAGVRSGQRIRLAGRGMAGEDGGQPGDLFLRIEVLPDPRFRLEGADIYTPLNVTPWQAALGGEAHVETPDGGVRVRVPAGSSSGRKIRLRGRGLKRQNGERGDLYAEIRIVVPEQLSERERRLYEELAAISETLGGSGRGDEARNQK
jgi:curved DNA-binding protein